MGTARIDLSKIIPLDTLCDWCDKPAKHNRIMPLGTVYACGRHKKSMDSEAA